MPVEFPWLQDLFLKNRGRPVFVDGKRIIQLDRVIIPSLALVHVEFVGDRIYTGNAAVIAVRKPDKILLSDNSKVVAVAIWDEPNLPRQVEHVVESKRQCLEIYNKYRTVHSDDFITEDSFTGNAGMHVIEISDNKRRYECSNAVGPVSLSDLVFEVSWEPRGSSD